MSTLTLKLGDEVKGVFSLDVGTTLSVGRRSGNDIVLEHLTVSGNHAKVDAMDEGFLLTDLRSKNGTFVNTNQVDNAVWLNNGDVISIGTFKLIFSISEDDAFSIEDEALTETVVLSMDDLMK